MTFRKLIFWLHLIAGLGAGIVILIMSATGVLLTYEKQVTAWADRSYLADAPTQGAPRLPAGAIVSKIRDVSGATPNTITYYSRSAAASAAVGGSTYYIDAHTGELLGTSSPKVRAFFRSVTDWHRYIAMAGDNRPTGKAITGAANLMFLFIVISGPIIWWRAGITWFKKGLSGKRLYWNWHHVFGAWTVVPLLLIVVSGTVMSYAWANSLVYTLTGSEQPAQGGGRGGNGGQNQNRNGTAGSGLQGGNRQDGNRGEGRERGRAVEPDFGEVDDSIALVENTIPDWKTIALRLPSDRKAPLSFTVDRRNAGQPQYRSTVTIDRKSGEIASIEKFEDQNLGRRTRSWLRFVHTGEYYGIAGQTIAGIASFSGALLVWTGFALSAHRLAAWLKGTRFRGIGNIRRIPKSPFQAMGDNRFGRTEHILGSTDSIVIETIDKLK